MSAKAAAAAAAPPPPPPPRACAAVVEMPRASWAIIANEACERWCFYAVRAVLVLYLKERLGYSNNAAISLYSFWVAASYLSPFVGGYVADALLGKYATILLFNVFYVGGLLLLGIAAATDNAVGSMLGLALGALGTGGIKPCVSAFGADQFAGASSPAQLTRFFLLFYFSINLGSTLSFVVTPIVRADAGYAAAFLLSFAVLLLAVLIFVAATPLYRRVPPAAGRSVYAAFARVLYHAGCGCGCGCACGGARRRGGGGESAPLMTTAAPQSAAATAPDAIGAESSLVTAAGLAPAPAPAPAPSQLTTGSAWLDGALPAVPAAEVFGVGAVLRLVPLLLCVSLFFALFDAQGSVWTLQREGMRTVCLGGGSVACLTTEQLGVLNPIFVLVLVPTVGGLTEALRARVAAGALPPWLEPTPLRRMAAGMLLTPSAFALTAAVQAAIDAAPPDTVSALWQTPQYFVITLAEVLVSATGLEWANVQAPPSMQTSVVALYLGTVALGNTITGVLYGALADVLTPLQLILLLMVLMAIAALAFVALAAVFQPLAVPVPAPVADAVSPLGAAGGGGGVSAGSAKRAALAAADDDDGDLAGALPSSV